MMIPPSAVPLNLRAAKRSLRDVAGLELMSDWQWYSLPRRWALRCRITIDVSADTLVPHTTEWFVTATGRYPWGPIKFYPALTHSLDTTFQHQNYNSTLKDWPWRLGDPCLTTTVRVLGRHANDHEPYQASGPTSRLRWHALRAIEWLRLASRNQLIQVGDPFEVPCFYGTDLQDGIIAFAENSGTFQQWQQISQVSGLVELSAAKDNAAVLVVRRFLTEDQRELLELPWGSALFNPQGVSKTGVWLRFPRVPVLSPWQSPSTWGEFRKVCQHQGIQLDQFLRRVARQLKEGDSHLLVGFPFPSKVGEPDEQMHWQAIELKPREKLTGWYPGFRPGKKEAIWLEMRQKLTGEREGIMWKDSQNWVNKELVARGALPAQLTERKILLIGAGSLASAVAELLLRAGAHRITILDGQDLRAGNLCRHTLAIQDLEKKKAEGLAKRLAGASPHAVVEAITSAFPPDKPEEISKVQECDLILDCTAEDDVLQAMSVFPWNGAKVFASLSLGFAAKRLFCFVAEGSRFPMQDFTHAIQPWLTREEAQRGDYEWPREAPGCWNPVFPARIDDVWMLAAIAVKQLAIALEASFVTTGLTVFEQTTKNGVFDGVRRLSAEVDHDGSGILVAKSTVRPHDTGERDRQDAS